jgi:hypothetical protein
MKLERRFTKGVSILGSYTLGHGIDNSINGEDSGAGAVTPQNPRDWTSEKSSSATDIRHRFVLSGIWDLPRIKGGNPIARGIINGWQVSGILTLQTGVPLTPTVTPNPANTTGPARPNRLQDGNLPDSERTIDRWFDRLAFAPATAFQYGNSGRHVIRAPGMNNLDATVNRNFKLGEHRNLEFRWEMYNFTNTAQFGRPNLVVNQTQGGTITATAIPNRQMQLGLRLSF